MRLRRVCMLLVVLAGCGGEESHIPPAVEDAVVATEDALAGGDPEEFCWAINSLGNELMDWQTMGRGNQPGAIERSLNDLDRLSSPCMVRTVSADVDLDEIREPFAEWAGRLRENHRVESGWGTILTWVFVPLAIGGFLLFFRRKFHEA